MTIRAALGRLCEKSPRYYWHWLPAKRHCEDLMASLDLQSFEALKSYRDQTGHPHYKKYFNMPYWLRKNMQRALFLKLHCTQAPLRILDIGAGFGYFPAAAAFFGHDVRAIDLPGDVLFDQACHYLGVDKRDCTVKARKTLPDLGGPFDLITAFQVCFNDHYADAPWDADTWQFFLDDLFENHVTPGGRVYLELNYHHKTGGWMSRDVKALFESHYHGKFTGPSRVFLYAPGTA